MPALLFLCPPHIGEAYPTIERDPPLLASATSWDAQIRRSAFDHIAKSYVVIVDKIGQAHIPRRTLAFVYLFCAFDLLRHAMRLFSFRVDKT
jgi:hypothetical protein